MKQKYLACPDTCTQSHPTRGVWIETSLMEIQIPLTSHTPHGVCGLKQRDFEIGHAERMSHPTRGVWIETCLTASRHTGSVSHPTRGVWIETWKFLPNWSDDLGHTPHGVCGLKQTDHTLSSSVRSHTPHGVCGLKHFLPIENVLDYKSHPTRGVWIETAPTTEAGTAKV